MYTSDNRHLSANTGRWPKVTFCVNVSAIRLALPHIASECQFITVGAPRLCQRKQIITTYKTMTNRVGRRAYFVSIPFLKNLKAVFT